MYLSCVLHWEMKCIPTTRQSSSQDPNMPYYTWHWWIPGIIVIIKIMRTGFLPQCFTCTWKHWQLPSIKVMQLSLTQLTLTLTLMVAHLVILFIQMLNLSSRTEAVTGVSAKWLSIKCFYLLILDSLLTITSQCEWKWFSSHKILHLRKQRHRQALLGWRKKDQPATWTPFFRHCTISTSSGRQVISLLCICEIPDRDLVNRFPDHYPQQIQK